MLIALTQPQLNVAELFFNSNFYQSEYHGVIKIDTVWFLAGHISGFMSFFLFLCCFTVFLLTAEDVTEVTSVV